MTREEKRWYYKNFTLDDIPKYQGKKFVYKGNFYICSALYIYYNNGIQSIRVKPKGLWKYFNFEELLFVNNEQMYYL